MGSLSSLLNAGVQDVTPESRKRKVVRIKID